MLAADVNYNWSNKSPSVQCYFLSRGANLIAEIAPAKNTRMLMNIMTA